MAAIFGANSGPKFGEHLGPAADSGDVSPRLHPAVRAIWWKRVDGESGSSLFRGIFGHLCSETGYPLVNCYITMERSTIFNGLINYKPPFSIAMMFVYQKVIPNTP